MSLTHLSNTTKSFHRGISDKDFFNNIFTFTI